MECLDITMGSDAEHPEILGFNSEVSCKGRTYHVQTETLIGGCEPTINTLVYHQGVLVSKISRPCADLVAHPANLEELRERVRRQHQEALARASRGDYPPRG